MISQVSESHNKKRGRRALGTVLFAGYKLDPCQPRD